MLTRENALNIWLNSLPNNSPFEFTPLAGDASFRRYFRLHQDSTTRIIMDAPPEQEGLAAFIHIARTLAEAGIRTPDIIAFDLKQGFALLEDFGDILLFDTLTSNTTHQHYERALDTLNKIQQCTVHQPKLASFNQDVMHQELLLFRTWFLEGWLGLTLSNTEEQLLDHAFSYITNQIMQQPQCFIHRDYHTRNLSLIGPDATIGILDFQDAMLGPFTYDLVSLLKDAYVKWPENTRTQWLTYFYNQLPNTYGWSRDAFERGFHLCGLQRHLKILGIFCRLNERDGKPRYLRDLPLTFDYILTALQGEIALRPLYDFMQTRVCPAFEEKKTS